MSEIGTDATRRIYAALEHEADLDGVVTETYGRLAEISGLSTTSVLNGIRELLRSGAIVQLSESARGRILVIQLVQP